MTFSAGAVYKTIRNCILVCRLEPKPDDADKLVAAMNALADTPKGFTREDAENLIKGWVEHPEHYLLPGDKE